MAKASQSPSRLDHKFLAVDVDYRDGTACAAGVLFDNWADSEPRGTVHSMVDIESDYRPGEFYLRELPCILALIEEHGLAPEVIVVDGYVYLDGPSKPGLGRRLFDALGSKANVVGVAKNKFRGIADDYAVLRGQSKHPLFVTAEGIDIEAAKKAVRSMHGENRIPTLLKLVDQECRTR